MNATTLYVEACRCMLSLSNESSNSWIELFQLLPKLRQALSCRVCRGLLVDPFGSQSCEHYVCRGCLKRKRSLNPGCRWCLNMEHLIPDQQTKILLACYQKLCEFVTESNAIGTLRSQNGEYSAIVAVINEAMASPIGVNNVTQDQNVNQEDTKINNNNNISSKNTTKMAEKSRGFTEKLTAEVVVQLPKRKMIEILNSINGSQEQKPKRKKRKHFKGTIYNYNKKRKLKKSEENELDSSNILCPRFLGTVQTIENAQDSNEEVQVVDEIPESELKTPVNPVIKTKCRCGIASLGSYKRCAGKRCACFSNYNSCEQCDCCNCSNPFNNNNERKPKELKPILEDEGCVSSC